jgi:thiosulfate/3-mercaptopyruvate sulfurtransferase
MSQLIPPSDLYTRLGTPHLRVIDVRASLSEPDAGQRLYEAGHIPGARFLSLEHDLAGPVGKHGGRHPLPEMNAFAQKVGDMGIGNDSDVVVYDADGGMFGARLWWLLRYAGLTRVQVLDGGFAAWEAAGLPVTDEAPVVAPVPFTPELHPEMTASLEEVRAKLGDPRTLLIDARAAERYRGEVEPLDKKAGHIPGALNKPFTDNLERGRFKSPESLRQRFREAERADEVILYCGSGVSAAHNALALEQAGIKGAKLYVGSWSDWSSYDENPVATGEES